MILRNLLLLAATSAAAADLYTVVSRAVDRSVQLPGEFQPHQSVALHAKIVGFVEEVHVDVGSHVKKSELLVTLSAPELTARRVEAEAKVQAVESQRAESEARVASLNSTYERLKAASATPGAVAGNELTVAEKAAEAARGQILAIEGSVKAARAAVESFRELESYLKVAAPFDGVITERLAHPGALAGPNAPAMLKLEQNSRLRLIVAVPEIHAAGIVRGARVVFTVPAFPGEKFSGVIARIPNTMDPKTRSMPVELDVANPRLALAPGMFATVAWLVKRGRASILVPPPSVVTTTERTFVIRVRNGAAEWVNVSKGMPAGDLVEVFGPLAAGDMILKRASDEIREGSQVK